MKIAKDTTVGSVFMTFAVGSALVTMALTGDPAAGINLVSGVLGLFGAFFLVRGASRGADGGTKRDD